MVRTAIQKTMSWPAILRLIACGSALLPVAAYAQESGGHKGSYRNEETPQTNQEIFQGNNDTNPNSNTGQAFGQQDANQQEPGQSASQGVVRLARFLSIKGNVTWRADEGLEWSQATINLPLRQGSQIWVTDGGRAELQFDDGSILRLGNGALLTLKTLYSDDEGEFTQITLNEGLVTLRAKHDRSVYRFDTPTVSVTAHGPARLRLGVSEGVEIAVRQGQANIEGAQGKSTLEAGNYLDLPNAAAPYDPRRLPREDSWDRWNDVRDNTIDEDAQRPEHQYLPANIAIVANNLEDSGTWHDDTEYGHVWCPRVQVADWRPYNDGHWTWVNPFGWTWVSNEAWGWAPYHYGTWVSRPFGWAWVPGPVTQYWSPAVVNFCESEGRIAWVPLAPMEVRYPTFLGLRFGGRSWSAYFSIGCAAVYYPTQNNYCEARPFNTGYINHVTYVNNITNITNVTNINASRHFAINHNTYIVNNRFIPYNARTAAGVTSASQSEFASRTAYVAHTKLSSASLYTQGRVVAAPPIGSRPVAGPVSVQATREALTPLHTFNGGVRPSVNAMNRSVYSAPLPAVVARHSAPIMPAGVAVTGRLGNTASSPTVQPEASPRMPLGNARRTPAGISPETTPRTSARTSLGTAPKYEAGAGATPRLNSERMNPVGRTQSTAGSTPHTYNSGGGGAQAAAQARASLGMSPGHAANNSGSSTYTGRAGSIAPNASTGGTSGSYNNNNYNGNNRARQDSTRTYTPPASRTYTPPSGQQNTPAPTRTYTPPPTRTYTPPAERAYSPPTARQSSLPPTARPYTPPVERTYTPTPRPYSPPPAPAPRPYTPPPAPVKESAPQPAHDTKDKSKGK